MLFLVTSITLIYVYFNPKHGFGPTTVPPSRKVPEKGMLGLIEEPSELDNKFGVDKEEHNVAEEDKDEPEEIPLGSHDGGDSNVAGEEKNGNDINNFANKPIKELPPSDGSVKFSGPQNERQRAVVAAFQHAWQGYRTYAWGKDHLKPISKTHQTW